MAAKVTAAEFEFREWTLGEGPDYAGKGRKSQPRPTTFPPANRIPKMWHVRLKAYLARRKVAMWFPPPDVGHFGKPGALYRRPDGGVEDVRDAHSGGLRWGLFSLDAPAAMWGEVGRRYDLLGIPWGYWFHCRTVAQLDDLLRISASEGRPIVGLNVELELATTLNPQVIADAVKRSGYKGQVAVIVLGWIQNGVDCKPISQWVTLLEVFPQDAPSLWPPKVKVHHCLEHARILGCGKPVAGYGCYAMRRAREVEINAGPHGPVPDGPRNGEGELVAQPTWYDRTIQHWLYTVDDTGERWEPSAWGFA